MPTSAKALGTEVGALLKPLQTGQGAAAKFVSPALLAAWPEIVGERLAGLCLPVQMKAKPKSRSMARSRHKKPGDDGAVLEVRADPSVRIDLDYGQALLVERINAFFGYQAVGSLKVLDKPMAAAKTANSVLSAPGFAPTSEATAQARAQVKAQAQKQARAQAMLVQDDALRAALERLGAAVLSQKAVRR
jgi:hypothetical protein